MRRRGWWAYDLVVVLAFVVIGRASHHHGETLAGIASTAWPFVVGLGVGWLALAVRGRAGATPLDGAAVAVVLVAVGMVLRVLAGQGTAPAFVAVALAFNGLCLVGARALARVAPRRA